MRHRLNSTLRTSALPLTPTAPDLLGDVVLVGVEVLVTLLLELFSTLLPVPVLPVLLLVPVSVLLVLVPLLLLLVAGVELVAAVELVLLVAGVVVVVVVVVAAVCLFKTPFFPQNSS